MNLIHRLYRAYKVKALTRRTKRDMNALIEPKYWLK